MAVIDIDTALQHVRAEEDDRAYVQLLLESAEDIAQQFINRQFFASEALMESAVLAGTAGQSPILVNPSIRAACLLILGGLYANREDTVTGESFGSMPMGSRSLLTPYRIGWGV